MKRRSRIIKSNDDIADSQNSEKTMSFIDAKIFKRNHINETVGRKENELQGVKVLQGIWAELSKKQLSDVEETKPRNGCRHDQSNTIIIEIELKTIRKELNNGSMIGKINV
jgi:hypothetical protein